MGGECSVPAREKLEVRDLRDRELSNPAVPAVSPKLCPDGFGRFNSEPPFIIGNIRHSLQPQNRLQESQVLLGSAGIGLRHVVLLPAGLDLFRSSLTS